MRLTNETKNIEIIVDSYEFPYDKQGFEKDNNWLNIRAVCEDEVLREEGIAACLLTEELEELIVKLQACLDHGDEYASCFQEPNLTVKVQRYEEDFAFYMSFLFKHHNEPFVFVKRMQADELQGFVKDLKEQSQKFPRRL